MSLVLGWGIHGSAPIYMVHWKAPFMVVRMGEYLSALSLEQPWSKVLQNNLELLAREKMDSLVHPLREFPIVWDESDQPEYIFRREEDGIVSFIRTCLPLCQGKIIGNICIIHSSPHYSKIDEPSQNRIRADIIKQYTAHRMGKRPF